MIWSHLTLLFYVAAMAFALIYGGFQKKVIFNCTMAFAWVGFLVQTAQEGYIWAHRGVPPATNFHELFQVTAWAVLAIYLIGLYPLSRSRILTFFLMPQVTLCFMLGFLAPDKAVETKDFFYTAWFPVHIFLLVFGIAFFFISFLYASIFIMQDHSLRHRHAPSSLPIPSLEEAQRWSTRLLLTGFPLFTLGILSSIMYGILYGHRTDWKPGLLEAASLVAWIVLGLAIYGWKSAKVHPRKRSWLVVAGAAFSALIILGIIWH